ncbi:hypothetical protein GQ457_10G016280 [Hibiscus cannabinus]
MQNSDSAQGRSSPRLYEDAGSRPHDGIPQVSRFPSLERPTSPTLLEHQRSSKKSKGNAEMVVDHDSMTIDDEQTVDQTVVVANMNQTTEGNRDGERPTYASKVAANGSASIGGNGTTGFREDVVTILEDAVILDRNRPSIQFSNRVHDQIDHNLRNALIIRLLGRTIGYNVLLSRIHALWKPVGSLQLIDIENNYFIVRFSAESDYSRVLTDGPWTIFGSYLLVQPWSRNFTTSEKYQSQVIVWVRIPGLSYRYYNKALFRYIALLLGKVVCVDYNTTDGKLEYEGLHNICFDCGVYGHSKDCCPLSKKVDEVVTEAGVDKQSDALISESNLYGPWMVVDNRRRRPSISMHGDNLGVSKLKSQSGSRFEALDVDARSDQHCNADVVVMEDLPVQEREVQRVVDSKASGSRQVEVIPIVEGQSINVVEHAPKIASGSHSAIRIIEDVHSNAGTTRGSPPSIGRTGKGILEVATKGFKVKKSMDSRATRSNVVEWVKSVHARIDQRTESGIMVGVGDAERSLATDGLPREAIDVEGASSGPFGRQFRSFMREHKPNIVALFEPRISGIVADRVIARMGFSNSYRVETNGFSGGIWLLWDDSIVIHVTRVANQFITVSVDGSCFRVKFQLTVVYASPVAVKRKLLWVLLADSKPPDHVP